jgi:hypothetical protein
MKLKTIILITGIMLVGLAFSATAQTRPEKTASAKAYYSHRPHKPKFKTKRYKKHKYGLRKSARKLRAFYKTDGHRKKSV